MFTFCSNRQATCMEGNISQVTSRFLKKRRVRGPTLGPAGAATPGGWRLVSSCRRSIQCACCAVNPGLADVALRGAAGGQLFGGAGDHGLVVAAAILDEGDLGELVDQQDR